MLLYIYSLLLHILLAAAVLPIFLKKNYDTRNLAEFHDTRNLAEFE